MEINVPKELAALGRMSVSQLLEPYAEVFGEATATRNRTWLVRRIAWRIQANAEGDLSERARQRATELARDSDLRITAPKEKPASVLPMTRGGTRTGMLPKEKQDDRLPPPGTVLTRKYKGGTVYVKGSPMASSMTTMSLRIASRRRHVGDRFAGQRLLRVAESRPRSSHSGSASPAEA